MDSDLEVLEQVFIVVSHSSKSSNADAPNRMHPDFRRLRCHEIRRCRETIIKGNDPLSRVAKCF